MASLGDISQPHLTTIENEGRRYNVSIRVAYDGVEYVGRLWFADESWDDVGLPDRGALPGRTREEVLEKARRLTTDDLVRRHRRALAEKRRFTALRKSTDEIIAKIRYLNQVAVSMRAGLLDLEGAAQEVDLTERQLHLLVDHLASVVGIED